MVVHTQKEVNYNIKGFIRKNKSSINTLLIDPLKNSTNEIVKDMFKHYDLKEIHQKKMDKKREE